MIKELDSNVLNKEDLESYLISKWGYAPDGIYRINSSMILDCDAALQLKEKGYEAVTAIKNAGIPYAKIFEMMGYVYSEIDYSHHKRDMKEPEISEVDIQKIIGKKVILTDIDFVTGKTFCKATEYLRNRKVKVDGAYIGLEDCSGRIFVGSWEMEKNGLRILNNPLSPPYKQRIEIIAPENFKIYTSTKPSKIESAIIRVSEYLKKYR